MNFPVQDSFWTEAAAFIRDTIGIEKSFIAPREFRSVLPRVFPYDYVHAIDVLEEYAGIAVHKGLLHELPLPVLQFVRMEWRCVFANEVFLFYMPPASTLPLAPEAHQTLFHESLESLKELAEMQRSKLREVTALLIVASHAPVFLSKTLEGVALLHVPTLVIAVTANTAWQEEYATICRDHRARFEVTGFKSTVPAALREGIRLWLEDPTVVWICSLDDTMLVRPDFLLVMEKLRADPARILGGLWTEADGVRAAYSRDGFQLIVPQRENPHHCYAHRDFWQQRFFAATGLNPADLSSGKMLIVRDLVMLQSPEANLAIAKPLSP